MNWAAFFAPIIKVIAEGILDLIYVLVEEWASNRRKTQQVTSVEKKNKAMQLAQVVGTGLDNESLDAAIELVHAERQERKNMLELRQTRQD